MVSSNDWTRVTILFRKLLGLLALLPFLLWSCADDTTAHVGMTEPEVLADGYWIPDGIAVIGEGEFLFADRGGALYHYAGGGVTEVRGLPQSRTSGVFGGLLVGVGGDPYPQPGPQDLSADVGKIHRLTADGHIPPDNPIFPGALKPSTIWSYGHRNPQGLYYDASERTLYATEHAGEVLGSGLSSRTVGAPLCRGQPVRLLERRVPPWRAQSAAPVALRSRHG